jgi:hypothetical protein
MNRCIGRKARCCVVMHGHISTTNSSSYHFDIPTPLSLAHAGTNSANVRHATSGSHEYRGRPRRDNSLQVTPEVYLCGGCHCFKTRDLLDPCRLCILLSRSIPSVTSSTSRETMKTSYYVHG